MTPSAQWTNMTPVYLFDVWSCLVSEIEEHKIACILLDFDGTLCPFARRPELASLPPETKILLTALSRNPRYRVAVISGRSLKDIEGMVGIQGITYAGNHGLEVDGPGISFVHPDAAKHKAAIKELSSSLSLQLRNFSGAIVEDKGLTASVHYRLMPDDGVEEMLRVIKRATRKHNELVLRQGKKVVEIRPNLPWGTGSASELIISRIGDCVPIYVGDDETDEEAFGSPLIAWSVRVIETKVPTKAKYFLRGIGDVKSFLERLASPPPGS